MRAATMRRSRLLLGALFAIAASAVAEDDVLTSAADGGFSWAYILNKTVPIVANGNIYPPPPDDAPDDCLVLVTRNQIMWHCPPGNATVPYERHGGSMHTHN